MEIRNWSRKDSGTPIHGNRSRDCRPLLFGAMLCLTSASPSAAEEFNPGKAAQTVIRQIEKHHMSRPVIDDRVSKKWLDAFIIRLDPKRMYFLDADVREFQTFKNKLDDATRRGEFDFARRVRSRLQKRVDTAALWAKHFLIVKHGFSRDEEIELRYADFAVDAESLRERWRKRIKSELLAERLHGVDEEEARSLLRERYRRIAKQAREMGDVQLCDAYLNSLTDVIDPASAYYTPHSLDDFVGGLIARYSTGFALQQVNGDHRISYISPNFRDYHPAAELIGWNLLAVAKSDGTVYDVVEMPVAELSHLLCWGMGASEVIILELQHPTTLKRRSATALRVSSRR